MPTLSPLAADLDPVALRHRIEADTQTAKLKAEAMVQLARIERRISWLERKHARLPIGNAKRKAAQQISEGKAQRDQLKEAIR